MSSADQALMLLENKVRRDILQHLVREPHYPLQLADLIGVSQQAVMKHLKILEKAEFVQSEMVPSEKGGPPKRIYLVQRSFSMRIDLGPDLFQIEQRSLPKGGPMRLSSKLPTGLDSIAEQVSGRKKIPFNEAVYFLGELDDAIETLDCQRDAMISLHQHIKHRASKVVDVDFETYEERHLVHRMLENPRTDIDINAIIRSMATDELHYESLMDGFQGRMMRILSHSSGHVISAPSSANLPWWAILPTEGKEKK